MKGVHTPSKVQEVDRVALTVSSDRQDVDLSVAAQLRALRDYAQKNGYLVAREYVDEAESGRIADRPQFRKDARRGQPSRTSPFQEILVWKFSRFTRKREHAVAFKSLLRGAEESASYPSPSRPTTPPPASSSKPSSRAVDEFYSENLMPMVQSRQNPRLAQPA